MAKETFQDTGLTSDDDDPMFDDDGYTTITPEFDEAMMLEALEEPDPTDVESELPPQEAYDAMKFMAPLSDEEKDILNRTPFLDNNMTWVDDPSHTEEMIERSRDGYKGIDNALEDQMYGDRNLSEEEGVEQAGTDSFGDEIEGYESVGTDITLGDLVETGLITAGEAQAMVDNGLVSGDEIGGWGLSSLNPVAAIKKGVKAVGKGAGLVAKTAYGAHKLAAKTAYGAGRGLARGAVKVAKKAGNIALTVAKMPVKAVMAAAKAVAAAAAWPIKRAARGLITSTALIVARKNGRPKPNAQDIQQANKISIATMNRSSNPMVKFGGKVLGFVGTGVSGDDVDTSAIGMTGVEIATLAAASAAAIFAAMAALKKSAAAAVGPVDPNMQMQPGMMDPSMMQPGMMDPYGDPSMMDPSMQYQDPYGGYGDPSMMAPPPMEAYPGGGAPMEAYPDGGMPMDPYGYGDPYADPYGGMYGDDESGKLYKNINDPLADIGSDEFVACDSTLGQFAAHVFSGADKIKEKVKKEDNQLKALMLAAEKGDLQAQGLLKMVAAAEKIKDKVTTSQGEEKEVAQKQLAKHKGQLKQLAKAADAGDAQALALLKMFAAADRAQKRTLASKPGASESQGEGDDVGLDPFLHKLNPMYWIKSARERNLIDLEKKYAEQRKDTEKKLRDQRKELNYGEAAARAEQMAKEAAQESIDIENRVRAIESTVKGDDMEGQRAQLVGAVIKKVRKNCKIAGELVKRASKRPLNTNERVALRGVVMSNRKLAKLAPAKTESGYRETTTFKSDFLGENAVEILGENAVEILGENAVEILGEQKISDKAWITMASIAAKDPKKLGVFTKQNKIQLSATQRGHLNNIVAMTRAQMKKKFVAAAIKGGASREDLMGISLSSVAKGVGTAIVTPIAAVAYGTYKALQYGKQKIFGGGGGAKPNPQQLAQQQSAAYNKARMARMQAAQQRKIAALRRQTAADAATEQARAEAQAAADAADAEADAKAAEAETLEMQNLAQEAAVTPGLTSEEKEEYYDTAMGAEWFTGEWVGAVKNKKVKKIVDKAASNTPTGTKIRAGAAVYSKAKQGDKKARVAVKKVQAQAAKGVPQAKADLNAIRAGRVAVEAKRKAQAREAAKLKSAARSQKLIQKRAAMEKALADKLARASRRKQFERLAKVEAASARGNKKAVALVKKQVVAAKKGDRKAKTNVEAMKLAREVRLKAKTPLERKNLRDANRLAQKVKRGNRKAVRQYAVISAAAAKGQPNAKRAVGRVQTMAKINRVIDTGKIAAAGAAGLGVGLAAGKVMKGGKGDEALAKKYGLNGVTNKNLSYQDRQAILGFYQRKVVSGKASKAEMRAVDNLARMMAKEAGLDDSDTKAVAKAATTKKAEFEQLKQKVNAGTATQEEAFAAAKTAQDLGNKAEAGKIALKAEGLPSSTNELKRTAAVAASDQAGNKEAKETVRETLAAAAKGEPAGIRGAGELEAVRSLDAVNHGRPMPAEMAKAVDLVERAQQNDPVAKEAIEKATVAAQQEDPPASAVKAAVALTAAGTVASALASKPTAKAQWLDEARKARGEKPKGPTFTEEPVPVPFDQTDVMTSLPDTTLPPITTLGELVRESLRALFLATGDPLQNYREGLASRGHEGIDRDTARINQLRRQKVWTPGEAQEGLALSQRYQDKNSEKFFGKLAQNLSTSSGDGQKEKELKSQLRQLMGKAKKTKADFVQLAKIDRQLADNASSPEAKEGFSSEANYYEKVASTMQGKEAPDEVKEEKEKRRQLVRASVWKALKDEKNQKKSNMVEAAAIMKKLNFMDDAAKIEKAAQKLQS